MARHAPVLALLLASACTAPPYEVDHREGVPVCDVLADACVPLPAERPAISPMQVVVPDAEHMPAEVVSQVSHNNLDIAWHQNRLFFAFRTAPTHFASSETRLYVVSTTDQEHWVFEAEFFMKTDLREPRFLSFDGKLFLYFAELGRSALAFEPQGAWVSEYRGPADWSEPEPILSGNFIPWRTKAIDGKPYMIAYRGGENIYENDGEPIEVNWLTTADGRTFDPVVPGKPVVLEGGASETAFVFTDAGDVVAVARNEAGDADGWGSKICRGDAASPADWTCASDPRKYDSPIMFRHGEDIYLIARRQVADDGNYDLGRRDLSPADQTMLYSEEYWLTPKRCALWRVDPEALSVEHVLDLPSAGDTCFAGVVPLDADQYLVYNYTSSLDDPDIRWIDGQTAPTFIYRLTLSL